MEMSEAKATLIRLYYLPQTFPCGPQSSCCGPVGQSEEELREYVRLMEANLPGAKIETIDVSQKLNLGRDLPAVKLLNAFGAAACPIFALNHEVISMGTAFDGGARRTPAGETGRDREPLARISHHRSGVAATTAKLRRRVRAWPGSSICAFGACMGSPSFPAPLRAAALRRQRRGGGPGPAVC